MMKRLLSAVAAVVLGIAMVAPAMAQEPGPGGPRGGGQVGGRPGGGPGGPGMRMNGMRKVEEKVLAQLNLTAAQKKAIADLNKKTEDQMKKIMADAQKSNDREATGKKLKAVMDARKAAMQKILTKDQNAKYEKLMKAEMEKMRKEREKRGAGGPGAKPGAGKPGGKPGAGK